VNRREFGKVSMAVGIGAATGAFGDNGISSSAAAAADDGTGKAPAGTPLAPPDKQPPHVKMPEKVERKLGYAIVGLGQLSIEEILPAFGMAKTARLAAFVSGHPDKARRLAEVYGVPSSAIYDYDGFDRMKDDKSIDVVYIVLPNSMHAEYTIRALKAGKHVLCEKPMAVSAAECEAMISAAKDAKRTLGVAYRLHYEPLNIKAVDLCRNGYIGKIKTISASNCQNTKAPNIRLSGPLGGGPVGDVGVYCINGACWATGEQPTHVTARAHSPKDDPRFAEVPESVSFLLEFPSGVTAACECSFGTSVGRRFRISGDKGFVEMDPAYAYSELSLKLKTGDDEKGTAQIATLAIRQKNQFAEEMDGFANAILKGEEPPTPGSMGLADVKTVTAIIKAARTGTRVAV
jgi:predicted dehydrogenase